MDIAAVAKLIEAAIAAIGTVIDHVRANPGDAVALRSKEALDTIIKIAEAARSGMKDPAKAHIELERLIASLDTSDAEADRALEAKFRTAGSPEE